MSCEGNESFEFFPPEVEWTLLGLLATPSVLQPVSLHQTLAVEAAFERYTLLYSSYPRCTSHGERMRRTLHVVQ